MPELHFEVLDRGRREVFDKLKSFSKEGVLGGGTALSLLLAHRKSYDLDVFGAEPIRRKMLRRVQEIFGEDIKILVDSRDELSFLTPEKIKISFIYFPFESLHKSVKTSSIPIFNTQDLASNKAYTIGRRGEYRDYVDFFFLLKKGLKLEKIVKEAQKRFRGAFSEKLFLEQLVYFGDLEDFTVEFIGEEYSPGQVLEFFKRVTREYTETKLGRKTE